MDENLYYVTHLRIQLENVSDPCRSKGYNRPGTGKRMTAMQRTTMLEGETAVYFPGASLGSLCWWLEIGSGASFSNLTVVFVFAVTAVS